MTVLVRALCLVLVLSTAPIFAAEPASEASVPDLVTLVSDMEKLLALGLPCPVGEAQPDAEWRACVERWENLKTEELYQPLVARPARGVASEPREADAEVGAPAHEN